MFFEFSEKEDFLFGAIAGDGFLDQRLCLAAHWGGEVLEEGLQLGGEQGVGDYGDELGEEAAEGNEGHEGVAGTGLEGLNGQADLEGEVVGLLDDVAGDVFEVGWGEGVAVAAVFEGIEVTPGSAGSPGAEFGVAMGAAAGVATHGPGAAAGDLTVDFVWVARHSRTPF